MQITIIHGQSHKGSTYHITRMLAEKLKGDITEFFLPKDFGAFCIGCTNCFEKAENRCPHYEELRPITEALDRADVIILASPVYVYHVTGAMKSFLDHYGYRWMCTDRRKACSISRLSASPLRQGQECGAQIRTWQTAHFLGCCKDLPVWRRRGGCVLGKGKAGA